MLHRKSLLLIYFFFSAMPQAYRILGLWPEIKAAPFALKAQSLYHWITGEVPLSLFQFKFRLSPPPLHSFIICGVERLITVKICSALSHPQATNLLSIMIDTSAVYINGLYTMYSICLFSFTNIIILRSIHTAMWITHSFLLNDYSSNFYPFNS